MKKLLGIVVLGLLLSGNAYSGIINLKCIWNSGYALPVEDLSSNKGKIIFLKIDLNNNKVLDSPSGGFENIKRKYKEQYVDIDEDEIDFGERAGEGARTYSISIDRNTGALTEKHLFNTEQLKAMIVNKYLCEKTSSKKKF